MGGVGGLTSGCWGNGEILDRIESRPPLHYPGKKYGLRSERNKMQNTPSKRLKTDDAEKKKDEGARAKKEKRQEQERIDAEKKADGEKRIETEDEKALKNLTDGEKKEATEGNPRNEGRKGSLPHIGCCPMGRMGGRTDKRTRKLTRMC